MSAQRAAHLNAAGENEILDVETSAAILRWMDSGLCPPGISSDEWERWVNAGCAGQLEVGGLTVTPSMLGCWARSGSLR
jgi:hypothetical protein